MAGVILSAFGCDDGRGGMDAGEMVSIDSGPGMMGRDGGPGMMGRDGGPGMMVGSDAGPMGAACREPAPDLIELDMDSMTMLLPRCAADTRTCYNACTDIVCRLDCISADMTPEVDIGGRVVDCGACLGIQLDRCVENDCATQSADERCCVEAAGCTVSYDCPACTAEYDAFVGCLAANGISTAGCAPFTDICFP